MSERITNSFNGGMNRDLDPKLRANDSYSRSVNGRLVFNLEGTYSWENSAGNKGAISGLPVGSTVIGYAAFTDFMVVFLIISNTTGDTYDIGFILTDEDGMGSYNSFVIDNSSELNFSTSYPLQCKAFHESDSLMRVYFTDDYNEPRAFTFKKDSSSPFGYSKVTEKASQLGMSVNWDMSPIYVLEQKLDGGSLLSGMYQYTYRLINSDGYKTPWFPPTRHIATFTGVAASGYENSFDDLNGPTSKSNNIAVVFADSQNYERIEIAYVFSITKNAPLEASIFYSSSIADFFANSSNVWHTSNSGEAIIIESIIDKTQYITKAKTIAVKNNRLWLGNIENTKVIEIPDAVFSALTVSANIKAMKDEHGNYGSAFSNTNPYQITTSGIETNASVWTNEYKAGNNSLVTVGRKAQWTDYNDPIIEHAHTGYFRGETYRFGCVFFDKKGNDLFTVHLADITFPRQKQGDTSSSARLEWTRIQSDGTTIYGATTYDWQHFSSTCGYLPSMINRNAGYSGSGLSNTDFERIETLSSLPNDPVADKIYNTGKGETLQQSSIIDTYLKILGLKIGGINVGVEIPNTGGKKLYELVGGFKIVRVDKTDAQRKIKRQGIYFQAASDSYNSLEVRPNPHPANWGEVDGNGNIEANHAQYADSKGGKEYATFRAFVGELFCPDVAFEGTIDGKEGSDHLYTVSSVWTTSLVQSETTGLNFGNYWQTKMNTSLDDAALASAITISGIPAFSGYEEQHSVKGIPWGGSIDSDNVYTGDIYHHHYYHKLYNSRNFRDSETNSNYVRAGIPIGGSNSTSDFVIYGSTSGSGSGGTIPLPNATFYPNTYICGKESGGGINSVLRYDKVTSKTIAPLNVTEWIDPDFSGGAGLVGDSKKWLQASLNQYTLLVRAGDFQLGFYGNNGGLAYNGTPVCYWILNWERDIPNTSLYGGATLEALQQNIFVSTGHFQKINDATMQNIQSGGNYIFNDIDIWGGDCYMQYFAHGRLYPLVDLDGGLPVPEGPSNKYRDFSQGFIFPVESKYNFKWRRNTINYPAYRQYGFNRGDALAGNPPTGSVGTNVANGLYVSGDSSYQRIETFVINDLVLDTEGLKFFLPKPASYVDAYDYPTRWAWSEEKKPFSESTDRFRKFQEISNFDLDPTMGEVMGSGHLFNNIYSIQEQGMGRLRIADRAMLQASTGADLVLGEGGLMDGIDYISKLYGTQHRDSIFSTERSIYWIDAQKAKILRFGQDGLTLLSDENGLNQYMKSFLKGLEKLDDRYNIGGLHTGFDFENNDLLFSILHNVCDNGNEFIQVGESDTPGGSSERKSTDPYSVDKYEKKCLTISYNENIGAFVSEYTFYPKMYMNIGKFMYTFRKEGSIHIHNKGDKGDFYGNTYYSYLEYSVNKFPSLVKHFDNKVLNINETGAKILFTASFLSDIDIAATIDVKAENILVNGYSTSRRVRYRAGLLRFPIRDLVKVLPAGKRISGKSMDVKLKFENVDTERAILTSSDTLSRIQHRV